MEFMELKGYINKRKQINLKIVTIQAIVSFVLNIFIHIPNSLKLITGSRLVRKYNLNTYK